MDSIQSPTQEPVISQPKPNYLIIIISSVLGIILLASITFLYFQNQQLKKQVVPTIKAPFPTPKTVSLIATTSDEMAKWKTFEDKYHGFSFKYPPTWQTPPPVEKGGEDGRILQTTNMEFKDLGTSMDVKLGAYIVLPYAPHVIANSLNNVFKEDKIIDIQDFSLDHQPAKIAQIDESSVMVAYQYPKPVNGDKYSWIELVSNPKNLDTERVVFEQILSTFKFNTPTKKPQDNCRYDSQNKPICTYYPGECAPGKIKQYPGKDECGCEKPFECK